MPNSSNAGDFDHDTRYRRPAAWRRVKEMSRGCDALCQEIEALCRDREGPVNCPRECLYAALHHFGVTMSKAQRIAAWMAMNHWQARERVAHGKIADDAQRCEPEFWETHTLAEVVAEALISSVQPNGSDDLRIIEMADYQPGDEPGSRCYWNLDMDQGVLWLYRATPLDVRDEIVSEAKQRFAEHRRED